MKPRNILVFIVCVAVPLAVGGISGFITSAEIDDWYRTLQKPSFNPPNWVFGPVWTILYIAMGVSCYTIWRCNIHPGKRKALFIFGIQLVFNFFWSILFFSFHNIFFALVDILVLWLLTFYMIYTFKKIRPLAAYINIPYLIWVSFATVLNMSIWWLNK